jgi:putative peptidoglycan lipid II flippase
MGIVLYLLNKVIPVNFIEVFTLKRKIVELCVLGLDVLVGGGCYFVIVYLMKVEEARYLLDMCIKKIILVKHRLMK